MLRSLNLKAVYRTDEDNLLEDFYIPALSVAVSYQRAVGFFSSAMLSFAAQGLSAFIGNQGKMQLVIGGELSPEDEHAIRNGYDMRAVSERLGLQLMQTFEGIGDALCYRRLEAIAWLIATGRLDIKVALRKRGMYHEKIGIITDADGDSVVFQGSANETAFALLPNFNFESINVFPTWKEELRPHFLPYVHGFKRLWDNEVLGTAVLGFPEAATQHLVRIAAKCRVPTPQMEIVLANPAAAPVSAPATNQEGARVPSTLGGEPFVMQPHQIQALNAWKANALRGILAHATGSGKTITAVYGAVRLFAATQRLCLIVSVPYQNLADQWVTVLNAFGVVPLRCYGSQNQWYKRFVEQAELFAANASDFLCCVVVNRTLQSDEFQEVVKRIPGQCLMWVGDECHHHASELLAASLPQHANVRIGLSATPIHYVDHKATERLKAFYGEVVSEFTLADALRAGVITPYDYHVHTTTLNASETATYLELSENIRQLSARRGATDIDTIEDDQLKALLMKRSRLLGCAHDKLEALRRLLQSRRPESFTLFYCGDGSTEQDDGGDAIRHVDQVSSLLYELGWKAARFTARESREEREQLLELFRVGAIDALVAIRCLDEGIDVPACRSAYLLASGRNPKQFIQRRGRILRKSAGKTGAVIYDFLVHLPPDRYEGGTFERALVAAELERVAEFAMLSRNSTDAVRALLPLLKEYDLAHVLT
jgi:superfamily II DNA or RNA helicase